MKNPFTKSLALFILLIITVVNSFAQTAITAANTTYVASTSGETYVATGAIASPDIGNTYTYNYGNLSGTTNNNNQLNNFTAGGIIYNFLPIPGQYVVLRRANNAVVQGVRNLKWDQGTVTGSNVNVVGTYNDNMENFFNGNSNFNAGTDNVFGNQGDGNGDNNDIERLDVIFPNGTVASDNTKVGFSVFERGSTTQHDPVKVALILSIDSTGMPTSYSQIIGITPASYGTTDVVASTNYVISRRDNAVDSFLKVATTTSQAIGGVLFKYSDFGIANLTPVYGYSLIPNDFTGTPAQALNYTDSTLFPHTTSSVTDSAGGIDPVGVCGISESQPVIEFPISGNVFDDANGLTDNTVNGTGTNINGKLYVHLVSSTNTVTATTAVNANGTYEFPDAAPGTYSIVLDTSSGSVSTAALPPGWVNTGENLGAGVGNDGLVNGILASVIVDTNNVINADFGIEQLPTANAVTAISQVNPSGTNTVTVPTLNGSDPEQGLFTGTDDADTITINTLPTNGTLYYNGVAVTAGSTIKNYNPSLLTIDPNNGAITLTFTYSEMDGALQSSSPATVTMPFNTIIISGNIFDDANGLTDNTVNGTGTNATGLNAVLINAWTGLVVASTSVNSNGTYNFSGLSAGNYTAEITTDPVTIGSTAPVVSLPSAWVNTGENLGSGPGSDGTINSILPIGTISTNTSNADFGIEQLPTANAVTAPSQVNPGGTNTVTVPTLNGSDPEQGLFTGTDDADTITINTLPTNGTLYYNGVAVTAGSTIKNYNPSLLTIDPNNGAITVTFTYSEMDGALQSSSPATVTMPFSTISISGNVFDDANGLTDNTVNGTGTNATGLNAVLINASTGLVIASTTVNSNGTYNFSGLSAGNYTAEITTDPATIGSTAPAVLLPSGWISTGENLGSGPGSDGTVSGILPIGSINTNTSNADFGIEQLPISNNETYTIPTPVFNSSLTLDGTSVGIPGPLAGTDPEDGTMGSGKKVVITTIPTNSLLYYNGTEVTDNTVITNYNPSLLQIQFTTRGSLNTSFQYVFVDAAGNQSSSPATYLISWATTLPVVLTNFTVENQNDDAVLNWETSSELNVKVFNIERSTDDGKTWSPIGEVAATGNSSVTQLYSFTDANPENGTNLYRLQIEDDNGNVTYSSVNEIDIAGESSMKVYPNPVGQEEALNIELAGLKAGPYEISMVSSTGQMVKDMTFTISGSGSAALVIPTGNIARGSYIVIVKGNNQQYSKTVIVANR